MEIDLTGQWQLLHEGQEVACALPGDVHTALLAGGRIPDPYFASNEDAVRWVMEREWVLYRTLELSPEQAAGLDQLEMDRVDTLATVQIGRAHV